MAVDSGGVLLQATHLKKWYPLGARFFGTGKRFVKAVDDVSLTIRSGETLGIVGESGCGKSTLARLLMNLIEPTSGELVIMGNSMETAGKRQIRELRRNMQIVLQDPYAALNPRQRVGDAICEPFLIHRLGNRKQALAKTMELLELVGLPPESISKFPHEFSGGQRQRICIARALAVDPQILVCDESVSALDVSIQAQIVNLLMRLQKQLGISIVFVSHDLRVVKHIASHVVVMYLGKVVESAPKQELFASPAHPYTQALLSAVPIPNPDAEKKRIILSGDIGGPSEAVKGCSFASRCFMVQDSCLESSPELEQLKPGHVCRCPVAMAGMPLKQEML
ncbi:MAG: dipeptide transporter ATP-binding protein [Paenibacillaceae bacterium]|jgi:peptide/nickel transport system ATP-binding protein/oligopeptide transport system ATP-binding protein|nr:dipeptide transporter ATP-binding protein [Paenibacillaceae bacterium]